MAERGCGGLIQAEAGVDVVRATARPGIVVPAQGHGPRIGSCGRPDFAW
jgi:hypothetical protein